MVFVPVWWSVFIQPLKGYKEELMLCTFMIIRTQNLLLHDWSSCSLVSYMKLAFFLNSWILSRSLCVINGWSKQSFSSYFVKQKSSWCVCLQCSLTHSCSFHKEACQQLAFPHLSTSSYSLIPFCAGWKYKKLVSYVHRKSDVCSSIAPFSFKKADSLRY